jgi:hypothetical protein
MYITLNFGKNAEMTTDATADVFVKMMEVRRPFANYLHAATISVTSYLFQNTPYIKFIKTIVHCFLDI